MLGRTLQTPAPARAISFGSLPADAALQSGASKGTKLCTFERLCDADWIS